MVIAIMKHVRITTLRQLESCYYYWDDERVRNDERSAMERVRALGNCAMSCRVLTTNALTKAKQPVQSR